MAAELVFTGQHPLDPNDSGLGRYRATRLDCAGESNPHVHAGEVTKRLLRRMPAAELVVVQGDTSSALGATLAAAAAGIPIAHVEAGLRSHDCLRPWPEEDFRIAIDAQAALLFAPTALSAANLYRERVRGQIHMTGNTGVDAVLKVKQQLGALARLPRTKPALLVTCHRRESWGAGLAGIAGALRTIAEQRLASIDVLLHPNPATAAAMTGLLAGARGIRLHPPLPHAPTVAAMLAADCVLSDSGGMQEECAALGVALLVLRERSERPEAIACGCMTLVGTDPERIVAAVRRLGGRGPAAPSRVYGDGRAGARIAALIEQWLKDRGCLRRSPRRSKAGLW